MKRAAKERPKSNTDPTLVYGQCMLDSSISSAVLTNGPVSKRFILVSCDGVPSKLRCGG